ncbi:hypothetical protein GQ53DRAFT_620986, partial [Thozetella sp. PMI_491]
KGADRQKRKALVCDACRKLEAECDATETSSCSACVRRGDKCQFTQDTGQRKRYFQKPAELARQLDRLRRENLAIKRTINERYGSINDFEGDIDVRMKQLSIQLPGIDEQPERKQRPGSALLVPELVKTRSNPEPFTEGIWGSPVPHRRPKRPIYSAPRPELPPRAVAGNLISSYYTNTPPLSRIISWQHFQESVNDLYKPDNLQNMPASFVSMFFATLALGSIFTTDSTLYQAYKPATLIKAARGVIDSFANSFVFDHARALLLIAMSLNELNLKSAAWNMLGQAIKVAQDLDLHIEGGPWSLIEGEMRRRTWWMAYILDQSLALEFGRPAMIHNKDYDTQLPIVVDDVDLQDPHNDNSRTTQYLLTIIQVVRSFETLRKAMKSPVIPPTKLASFDKHLDTCFQACPKPPVEIHSQPGFFSTIVYPLHSRMLLHRHNLSPACPLEARLSAIEKCTSTALETASLIQNVSLDISGAASALFTTHIFRCSLFLILSDYLDEATACIKLLAAISNRREVAIPCGRFIGFFISTLASKRARYASLNRPSEASRPSSRQDAVMGDIMRDEDLLAYVSTDMQANPDIAWVWAGSEEEVQQQATQKRSPPFRNTSVSCLDESASATDAIESEGTKVELEDDESNYWGGWRHLEDLVRSSLTG